MNAATNAEFRVGAAKRADQLEKLAAQVEAIKWRPEAVMRENAHLIRGLLIEITEVERQRDACLRYLGIGHISELPSGTV